MLYTNRIGTQVVNSQGYIMTVIAYKNADNIIVKFNDEFNAEVKTTWDHFYNRKTVKNPYHPTIYNVGRIGNKYPTMKCNGVKTKEYETWKNMLERCFSNKLKQRNPTYLKTTCVNEWLLFENFYEWLHSQENFNKWINGCGWSVDKDILLKGNKLYSPNMCCLVPKNVNILFCKADSLRGTLPIGVSYDEIKKCYRARVNNPLLQKVSKIIGYYDTTEEAFMAYKTEKEKIIKEIAELEFQKSNITKKCYEAMMNYKVEITD